VSADVPFMIGADQRWVSVPIAIEDLVAAEELAEVHGLSVAAYLGHLLAKALADG
jgi:hypothetical protein